MLGKTDAMANVAVRHLASAEAFYTGTLGLEPESREGDEAIVYRSGATRVIVYRSRFAGTGGATVVSWSVGDALDAIVAALGSRGVRFERYDLPGMTHDGDVHVAGDMRVAWFKDPDGNILCVMNR